MKFGVKSDKGMIRVNNEDSYNIIAGYPGVPVTFVIADGMGGHNSGEIASRMAVDIVSNYMLNLKDEFTSGIDMPSKIKSMMEKANADILEAAAQDQGKHGMGTTLIVATVVNKRLFIGHIGDSRAYIVRNGIIKQITTDHSLIEELIRNGTLTREEAENHPKKNIITRALGCFENIEVDTYEMDILDSDIFVLCTDGLTNMLDEEKITEIIYKEIEPEQICNELVKCANDNGGEDNISVIVFKN